MKGERNVSVFTLITLSVLQTEAGFVSLCHFSTIQTQQVIVGENLHTVVMSGNGEIKAVTSYTNLLLVSLQLYIWH